MNTLIMIPGMMCDERLFAPQVAQFSGEWNISIPVPKGYETVAGFANEILCDAPPKFALLGLSMGGIIAMEVLRQAKGRVERIALLDTNPLAEKDEVKQRRIPQMEAARNGKLREVLRDEMKPNYLADGPNKQDILVLCMDMAVDLGADVFLEQSKALRDRRDQSGTLKTTDIPALVLCGREDALCPVERHELMHELMPNSTLEIIDDAGHMPVLEQAEITNSKIKTWLER